VTARSHAHSARDIPEATVARLPVYLRALSALADQDITTCSSEELAAAAGVNSAKLRKDLSYLGSYGTRGVGYDVDYLRYQIAREIGVTQDWPVVIVGIGNLGHALANFSGFRSRGFRVVALLDADPERHR
jgi:redox-sensing transcriptional repressor